MTDKQQTEALRLADALERPGYGWHSTPAQCAAELRRLHAENETLLAEAANNARIIGSSAEIELALRARVDELERKLVAACYAHECHEALTACINLLKKTPKITQSIFVGKDRQAWGVQAKTVLDAAIAAIKLEAEEKKEGVKK